MIYHEWHECRECGQIYPIVPYHKAAAPHGPDKDCRSREWRKLTEEEVEALYALQEDHR